MSKKDYCFKYIIVGDSSVGKSCFMLRYTDNRFNPSHDVTIGLEYGSKVVKVNKSQVKLQIWDTAGQENFRSIARSYYRGAVGLILMYDITNKDSFLNTFRWLKEILEVGSANLTIALVGNKKDLSDKRRVSVSEGQDFANSNNMVFFESSAVSGENVENVFLETCQKIMKKVESGNFDFTVEHSGVKVMEKKKGKVRKNCC